MNKKLLDDIKNNSEAIKTHLDLLQWLEGDFQSLIEHQILIMAWGDFSHGRIQFDVLSSVEGIRTTNIDFPNMHGKVMSLFDHWTERKGSPFSIETDNGIFEDCFNKTIAETNHVSEITNLLVHGIHDHRTGEDCLYLFLRSSATHNTNQLDSIKKLVMFLDAVARRIHYPTKQTSANQIGKDRRRLRADLLSARENEVMEWVIKGKSNDDIAIILKISAYTVKNHIYRIYKKLNVCNRAQAASLLCR